MALSIDRSCSEDQVLRIVGQPARNVGAMYRTVPLVHRYSCAWLASREPQGPRYMDAPGGGLGGSYLANVDPRTMQRTPTSTREWIRPHNTHLGFSMGCMWWMTVHVETPTAWFGHPNAYQWF